MFQSTDRAGTEPRSTAKFDNRRDAVLSPDSRITLMITSLELCELKPTSRRLVATERSLAFTLNICW
jgi:hypothetical protein